MDRRAFLGHSAAATLALVRAGTAAETQPATAARLKNSRPGLGVIGFRYQGSVIAERAKPYGDIVAIADADKAVLDLSLVDKKVTQQVKATPEEIYAGVTSRHQDYRRLLDDKRVEIVLIGAPDHWHSKMIIDAVQAGKDVYCEKPLTLTVAEGEEILKAVNQTGRIVQVGSWQRSDHRFRTAVEMVRQGRLGKLQRVDVVIGANEVGGPFQPSAPPASIDWNLWQGQTPSVPYIKERCHFTFRWWLEYSGGQMTDWGAHHLDIAQWAIGSEPIGVKGTARYPTTPNGFNVPLEYAVEYRYPGDVTMSVADHGRTGIMFTGSEGRIFVNRGSLTGKPVEDLADNPLPRDAFTVYDFDNLSRPERAGKIQAIMNHMGNFFDCVEARRQPVSDVVSQHASATTCHLGNIACRLGRPLEWNAEAGRFVNDSEADAFLSRPQREGFEVRA
ncbi:MAG: gfo/Idh/MocA family oxidoreductase [Planctomycetia bacterium]|nr:gfo/Idh/MocA family oxidoreductase [Planctomycetia bacterium]